MPKTCNKNSKTAREGGFPAIVIGVTFSGNRFFVELTGDDNALVKGRGLLRSLVPGGPVVSWSCVTDIQGNFT